MMRQEGEPSVEEILESIKKVIARDNRDSADALRRRRETDGLIARPSAAPADDDEADGEDDILDLSMIASQMAEPESAGDGLTNAAAADAMRQSLAALSMLAEPSAPPRIVRSGETSLEGLVREMLRPMMAQWLDANLPDIVERLVTAEISRIAGKKR
jgi:cell pole-organizing protein PopZ